MSVVDTIPDSTPDRAPAAGDLLEGLAELLPQLVQEVVLDSVRGVHLAVAERTFPAIPLTSLVRSVHDAIATGVYGVLDRTVLGTGRALLGAARRTASVRDVHALQDNRPWRATVAILNGILGDALAEQGNPLAIRMSVRADAADVALDPAALAAAHPDARNRIAVLLHGLVESDDSWTVPDDEGGRVSYPRELAAAGVTPVLVRYNSGRHISDNAIDLAALLEELVASWPVPLEEVLLVGHSMGGLVLRGAADVAACDGLRWPRLVRHVVLLGSPHAGAPLERIANSGAWLLSRLPESTPFAAILRRRSAGIKDLRHGYVSAEDWRDLDPDGLRGRPASCAEGLSGVTVHNVGATLTVSSEHPMSDIVGDLLVGWSSARAVGQTWAESATAIHVGGTHHFGLLNHPDVADLLVRLVTTGGPEGEADIITIDLAHDGMAS